MSSTTGIEVDPSNADALSAWDGADGDYWTEHADVFERSLRGYETPLFRAAAIERSDRVLDIGCGTGDTTRAAARLAHAGSAVGVDLSSRMIDHATELATREGLRNVRFLQADAQIHRFDPGRYDVAISRTGSMFFGDPVAAFTNIARALRPGGRIALLVWQALPHNHWVRDFATALTAGRQLPTPPPGAPGPFAFADPELGTNVLAAAGFIDISFEAATAPMWFGPNADTAYTFVRDMGFTRFMLRDLDEQTREHALDDLRASIDAHDTGTEEGVVYQSAAWIVTAKRPQGG
jgi:SAM-dependent methyltransferase